MSEPNSSGTFTLSSEDIAATRAFHRVDHYSSIDLSDLVFDNAADFWREMLAAIRRHNGDGQGECIAIVDSGYGSAHSRPSIDRDKCIDLTCEGLEDRIGHGTAVSTLISCVAPRAIQYHVKLFARRGIPGATVEEKSDTSHSRGDTWNSANR